LYPGSSRKPSGVGWFRMGWGLNCSGFWVNLEYELSNSRMTNEFRQDDPHLMAAVLDGPSGRPLGASATTTCPAPGYWRFGMLQPSLGSTRKPLTVDGLIPTGFAFRSATGDLEVNPGRGHFVELGTGVGRSSGRYRFIYHSLTKYFLLVSRLSLPSQLCYVRRSF